MPDIHAVIWGPIIKPKQLKMKGAEEAKSKTTYFSLTHQHWNF